MNQRTKQMTAMAMICAIGYVLAFMSSLLPGVLFLKYDPKDVIIVIGGFIYGPLSTFFVSLVVSLLEMITISADGFVGFIMNVLATCSFACTASFVYKKRHSLKWAVIGLGLGCIAMTVTMILWNFLITPLYMGVTREAVVELLLPVFLPFNIIKSVLNASLAMAVYRPVVAALRKSHLIPESQNGGKKTRLGLILIYLVIIASAVMAFLALADVI